MKTVVVKNLYGLTLFFTFTFLSGFFAQKAHLFLYHNASFFSLKNTLFEKVLGSTHYLSIYIKST